jgi:hypothetical protein
MFILPLREKAFLLDTTPVCFNASWLVACQVCWQTSKLACHAAGLLANKLASFPLRKKSTSYGLQPFALPILLAFLRHFRLAPRGNFCYG